MPFLSSIIPLAHLITLIVLCALYVATLVAMAHFYQAAKNPPKSRTKKNQQYYRHTLWITAILAVVIIIVFVSGLLNTAKIRIEQERAYSAAEAALPEMRLPVDGSVIEAIEPVGVAGLELTVLDTTIRTSEGGQFSFPSVGAQEGIRINHPELLRSVNRRIDEAHTEDIAWPLRISIMFDLKLYNTLIKIADIESRLKIEQIYGFVDPGVQKTVSKDAFIQTYRPLFGTENTSDQTISVGPATRHVIWDSPESDIRMQDVVEVAVHNKNRTKSYFLIKNADEWKLVF